MREAECARSNLAEDLSRLRMELEKVTSLSLLAVLQGSLQIQNMLQIARQAS